jgi:hypothetical protein
MGPRTLDTPYVNDETGLKDQRAPVGKPHPLPLIRYRRDGRDDDHAWVGGLTQQWYQPRCEKVRA